MQWCSTGCLVASYHQSGNVGSGPRVAAGSSHTSARPETSRQKAENLAFSLATRSWCKLHDDGARLDMDWMDFLVD